MTNWKVSRKMSTSYSAKLFYGIKLIAAMLPKVDESKIERYCGRCNENYEEFKFCPKCGNELDEILLDGTDSWIRNFIDEGETHKDIGIAKTGYESDCTWLIVKLPKKVAKGYSDGVMSLDCTKSEVADFSKIMAALRTDADEVMASFIKLHGIKTVDKPRWWLVGDCG